jgi:hypothetical protein
LKVKLYGRPAKSSQEVLSNGNTENTERREETSAFPETSSYGVAARRKILKSEQHSVGLFYTRT